MVGGWACSTGERRDQYYGTDVGVGWVPGDGSALPDGGANPDARPATDAPTDMVEAGPDAGPETAAAASDAPAGDTGP
jgi:hypothetical protein